MAAWDVFACIGAVTVSVLIAAALGIAIVFGAAFVAVYRPRLHFGKPQNTGELSFYDARVIVTAKGGEPVEAAPEHGRIIQRLGLRWWVGLSSRTKASWFVGIIRWKVEADAR